MTDKVPSRKRREGFRCPDCDSDRIEVTETRSGENFIIRRRRCENGHFFVTKEVFTSPAEYNEWRKIYRT